MRASLTLFACLLGARYPRIHALRRVARPEHDAKSVETGIESTTPVEDSGRASRRRRWIAALALLVFLSAENEAAAHRLDAQVTVLPARKVQVESWFSNGDVPRGAKVEIFTADGKPMRTGTLDERGAFTFVAEAVHAMRVVVSAGAGHRKELEVTEDQLKPTSADNPVRVSSRETGAPLRDVLSGLAFLLGLGAFVISVRNARKLKALGQKSI